MSDLVTIFNLMDIISKVECDGEWYFQNGANDDSNLEYKPTEDSSIFFEGNGANLKCHDKRCILIGK